jgi:hypothetical protein
MDCLECGAETNYHRAVVELVTGTVLGSYCVACEQRRFGDALDAPDAGGDDRCACCDRLGHYVLPVYAIDVDITEPNLSIESAWLRRDAPRLCFDHLFELADPADLARRRRHGVAWYRP